jgi:hypothetical protein
MIQLGTRELIGRAEQSSLDVSMGEYMVKIMKGMIEFDEAFYRFFEGGEKKLVK